MKNLTMTIPDATFDQFAARVDATDKRDDDTRGREELAKQINQWAINRAQGRIMACARQVAADAIGSTLPVIEVIPDISAAVEETPPTPAVNVDV